MPSRRTKIVATLGPATQSVESVAALIEVGMDVARINFSHGSYEAHAERIRTIRQAAEQVGRPVAILQDLQGPKIRTGLLAEGGPVELREGNPFTLTTESITGDALRVATSYEALPRDVETGDRIFLSDGSISLVVRAKTATEVHTEVVFGGLLKERQGINLPGVRISAPGVTQKDFADLAFGLEQEVDYVAISFVRSAADVRQVKERVAQAGRDTGVIAKLEKPEAIEALHEIVEIADGVMVARGDLGVELSAEKVPLIQKQIIREANHAAKPVITATQMLESMIENPRPTRAEASDVANAILDGTDAVMLSGETAVGKHPVKAIETIVRVAREIEANAPRRLRRHALEDSFRHAESEPEAIGAAVQAVVAALPSISAVWVFTQSGSTARLIARHRPRVPIVSFSPSERCHRRVSLIWGVTPVLTEAVSSFHELTDRVFPLAIERGVAKPGDHVVMTGSHPFDAAAPTNFLKLHVV